MAKQPLVFSSLLLTLVMLCFSSLTKGDSPSSEFIYDNKKVIQIAVTNIPSYFSPYALSPLDDQYSHLFFDPLVRWGNNKKIEFRLLDKLQTLKSGKTRFYLKQKIYFHSGNMLTSDDVIWSFNQALKNKRFKTQLSAIKLEKVNRYQFDIQTDLNQSRLLDYLTHIFILDAIFYKKNKILHNQPQPTLVPPIKILPLSGTGPYQIKGYNAKINLSVEGNLHYWQKAPTFSLLNFINVKSADSRLYALLANDVDISESISNKSIKSIAIAEDKKLLAIKMNNALFLAVNDKKNEIFTYNTARNALHLAINQQGMVKHILYGMGQADAVFMPVQITESELPNPALPNYDVKRAGYLIKKMKMPKALTLLVMNDKTSNVQEVSNALVNMLKKVDIRLEITTVNSVAQWHALQADFDLSLSNWHSPMVDSDNIYADLFADSLVANSLNGLFVENEIDNSLKAKAEHFTILQESHRIIPILSQDKLWAANTRYGLQTIFSTNGIAYWHLLALHHSEK